MKDDYLVKLDAFEGPMDLLMHLIEKNKIDLYDIPIADLTRQYLDHIDRLYQFDIEYASEFLVMAATLLRIKARMLLPRPKRMRNRKKIRAGSLLNVYWSIADSKKSRRFSQR